MPFGTNLIFGMLLRAEDYVSPVLRKVLRQFKEVEQAAESTQRWREVGAQLAMTGAALGGIGAAGAFALTRMLEPAVEMQAEMAHVSTAIDDGLKTTRHLAEAQEMANAVAAKSVIGNKELADSYYIARSNMLHHKEALDAVRAANDLVIATTRNAADAQAQMEPTTRTLTTLMETFGGSSQHWADMMAKLQTTYAFRDISEITYALQYAIPVMKQTHIASEQAFAALALLSAGGEHGQEAGTAFQEMMNKIATGRRLRPFQALNAEGGTDLIQTIQNLYDAFGHLTASERAYALKEVGFGQRDIRGVSIMLDKVGQFKGVAADMFKSQGAAAEAARKRMAAFDEQWGKLLNNIDLFKEALGTQLLPAVAGITAKLTSMVQAMTEFAEHHKSLVRYALYFTAIASAAALAAGSLAMAGAAFMFTRSYLPASWKLVTAVGRLSGVTKLWAAAQWLVNGAMAANPIALAIIGVAALGVAVYEIYKHWAAVKNFLDGIWNYLAGIDWAALGLSIVKGIASGFLNMTGLGTLGSAVSKVGGFILDHFPHSPAKLGPLRQLGKVNIVQTIAETMKPGPMLSAVGRTAAAVAMAAPMMAAPAMAAPSLAGGARGAGIAHYAPTINVTVNGPGDADTIRAAVRAALREHADELHSEFERVRARKARTEWE